MATEPLIVLDNVTKVFLTDEVETHALAGINFSIGKGDYVSIAGPSGCGKSTLLSILGLLDTPSAGTYVLTTALCRISRCRSARGSEIARLVLFSSRLISSAT